jgi:hypothetical protein
MKVTEVIELVQKARRAGGDKYQSRDGLVVIYVPQYISRSLDAEPPKKLKVTFED